ncbi:gene transfer agent family protein [Fulvimarina endophytica]|uniref:gene transfer agent family protein n=1 Tax=Fulvimarina endophytica TaxID=2293836 RepID=UPI0026A707CB
MGAVVDGTERRLCLTLGALADLETAFGAEDLPALAARLSAGRLSARDLAVIIAAGFRGAGEAVGLDEVAAMRFEGGVSGAARLAVELLTAAFGEGDETGEEAGGSRGGGVPGGELPDPALPWRETPRPPRPFPGTMSSPSGSAS